MALDTAYQTLSSENTAGLLLIRLQHSARLTMSAADRRIRKEIIFDDVIYPLGHQANLPLRSMHQNSRAETVSSGVQAIRRHTAAINLQHLTLGMSQPEDVHSGMELLRMQVFELVQADQLQGLQFKLKLLTDKQRASTNKGLHVLFRSVDGLVTYNYTSTVPDASIVETSQVNYQPGFAKYVVENRTQMAGRAYSMPLTPARTKLTSDVWQAGFEVPEQSSVPTVASLNFRSRWDQPDIEKQDLVQRFALLVVRECADDDDLAVWDMGSDSPEVHKRSSLDTFQSRRLLIVRRDAETKHCDVRLEAA